MSMLDLIGIPLGEGDNGRNSFGSRQQWGVKVIGLSLFRCGQDW